MHVAADSSLAGVVHHSGKRRVRLLRCGEARRGAVHPEGDLRLFREDVQDLLRLPRARRPAEALPVRLRVE